MTRFFIIFAVLLIASTAYAQTDDAVLVVPVGGVESLPVFDLTGESGEREAIFLGERRLVHADVGPIPIADLKVLPDGSRLVADADGRGAAVIASDGTFRWVFDTEQRYPAVDAVSVASYFAPGQPSQLLIADTGTSVLSIRDTVQQRTVWIESMLLDTARGRIVQAIVLPQNRVASATNWPTTGVSAIEVFELSEAMGEPLQFANREFAEASSELVVVPQIDTLRDLMAWDDDRFLVTTQFAVFEMNLAGEIAWELHVADHDEIRGELASARLLPSGLIALVTFQPGEWAVPHVHHRIHWYDPEAGALVASSAPLERAPLRVEPLAGHGATGTLGFTAGLDDIAQGRLDDVALESLTIDNPAPIGRDFDARASLRNDGSFPVGLSSVAILAFHGTCNEGPRPSDYEIGRVEGVVIQPDTTITVTGEAPVAGFLPTGAWCAWIEAEDQAGRQGRIGDVHGFEVVEAGDDGTTIVVEELPFGENVETGDDVGLDGGVDAASPTDEPAAKGCCRTASSEPSSPAILLVLLGIGLVMRRRRHIA